MPSQTPHATSELVINWHITEACNYACKYCYATWRKPISPREVFHDPVIADTILKSIADYFHWDKRTNPLAERLDWNAVRLSIAGGEPLLYPDRVIDIAHKSRELGMDVSLITNGSRLDVELMRKLAPELSMIGISIDSDDGGINRRIGREDRHGQQLDLTKLSQVIEFGRKVNPRLKVKINTVVSTENWNTGVEKAIDQIQPDKWKVLRVLPVVSDDMRIRRDEFRSFVKRHVATGVPMYAEDNDEMVESYIMIDPHGRFFQNRLANGQKGHVCSSPIHEVGVSRAFESLRFDADQFAARYVPFDGQGS